MTLDLCNIRQATNGEAEELPVERMGNRLPDRRLADTRRADETDDLALDRSTKLANGQEL